MVRSMRSLPHAAMSHKKQKLGPADQFPDLLGASLFEGSRMPGRHCLALLWMDEIHFAPPKEPWNDGSPANSTKQWLQPWFPSGAKWILAIHSGSFLSGMSIWLAADRLF